MRRGVAVNRARGRRAHRTRRVGTRAQQVADEVVADRGQFGLRVLLRVGVEVEREAARAVGRAVDVEGEPVHGPGGQLVGDGFDSSEAQRAVEGHDVEHQAAEPRAGPAQFAPQLLAAVALVAQRGAQRSAHLPQDVGDGVPAADREAQRKFVGEHAGRGQRGAADAGGQRQSEQHLVVVADRPAVGGDERDHEDRPGHAAARAASTTVLVCSSVRRPLLRTRGPVSRSRRGSGASAPANWSSQ